VEKWVLSLESKTEELNRSYTYRKCKTRNFRECVEFNIQLANNSSFWGRVFPANHLAVLLTKQTYNTQDKHNKPEKLNHTNPGLVASYSIHLGLVLF